MPVGQPFSLWIAEHYARNALKRERWRVTFLLANAGRESTANLVPFLLDIG
jgi:hypothetical protein